MGGTQSKREDNVLYGSMVDVMTRKYGKSSVQYLSLWTQIFGFPVNRSFRKIKLAELRGKLESQERQWKLESQEREWKLESTEREWRSRKTVKVTDLEKIEGNRKCLIQGETECECRERKQLQKQLAGGKKIHPEKELDSSITPSPNKTLSSSVYLTLTGFDGPLLDACIQRRPEPPQPQPEPVPEVQQPPPYQHQIGLLALILPTTPSDARAQREALEEMSADGVKTRARTLAAEGAQGGHLEFPTPRFTATFSPVFNTPRPSSTSLLEQRRGRGRSMNRGRNSWNQAGPQRDPPSDNDVCFHCGVSGHWSRDCPQKGPQRGNWNRDRARDRTDNYNQSD